MGQNAKGALLALLAFGVFATHDVVVKVLGGAYSPFQLIFFSVTLAFPLAMVMIIGDPEPGTLRPRHPWWVALRTAAGLLTATCAFYAFSVLPLAPVYALIFASPLIITVLAIPVLGESVGLRRWLAVLVGLIGVLVVLRPGQTELGLGHLAALGAALGGSTASIVVRKIGHDERPIVLLLYPMIANFVVMGLALPFVYEPMPIEHLGLMALIAVLGWTAGRIMVAAYSTGEAVVVAPMQYSQILWATAYGALFFSELPDGPTALGAGIIIASGIYIVAREGRGGNSAHRPVSQTRLRYETGSAPRASVLKRFLRPGRFRAD
ncbi:DMT family transporter [Limimaricola hongkongensis]|uniref:Membrane protein, putative n=1 Tax=Limimaricola hongkongensis DSM 17492 TaxID=1122180 RepID=A0A017HFI1_9RHOB|nr:DMT family transporter [Limimaricola hongkongensis]EYD73111.1 Membrane protein, putative [Limimaricola hongkongensis DSM 17492]